MYHVVGLKLYICIVPRALRYAAACEVCRCGNSTPQSKEKGHPRRDVVASRATAKAKGAPHSRRSR